ncbi:MAG TPA: mycothiol synthase [Microthrixaceae bacterium]|nr:mycothiol synthase [Microthrixaceae bacterium]
MTTSSEITMRLGSEPTQVGGREVWWVKDVRTDRSDELNRVAAELGLIEVRRLHQLRRPLPIEAELRPAHDLPVRAFDPRTDPEAWLDVNNRAFDFHPDQGGWTAATLRSRMGEEWFDLEDFLVHDGDDGRLDGFCWTKVHRDLEPMVGEIYVIAAAPERHGTGLGRALLLAGLDHLWQRHGTPVGMLYVESDNDPAMRLYERLGFRTWTDDLAYASVDADADDRDAEGARR